MAGRRQMHSEEWWATQKPAHVLRCTGTLRTTGKQCRNEARPGTNVCDKHGGAVPVVQAAAARRIGMSVDDAAKKLLAMVEDPNVESRDKIKILHDLLDRGGLAPTSKVLLGVVTEDPVEKLFQAILQDPNGLAPAQAIPHEPTPQMIAWNREALEAYGDEDVVEAELVEEPEPDEPHTIRETGKVTTQPPAHIRRDLERLGLL